MMSARSWWKVVGAVLLGSVATVALCLGWLLRDPVPRFDARRGAVREVRESEPIAVGRAITQDVELVSSSGLTVRFTLRRPAPASAASATVASASVAPESAAPVRRALFVILGGHERGRAAVALLPDTLGMIFAALDYPFTASGRLGWIGAFRAVPAIRRALYDTPPSIALALDHLLARPDVDSMRVELVGASFGAPFTTIAAARDPRVARLWLAHAGGDLPAMFAQNLRREVRFAPARFALAHLLNLLASGPRFAPERWIGAVSPRPVVMLNAEEDAQIPRESVELLWNAAREPKELVWLPGGHMRGDRPEVISALIEAMVARAATAPTPR